MIFGALFFSSHSLCFVLIFSVQLKVFYNILALGIRFFLKIFSRSDVLLILKSDAEINIAWNYNKVYFQLFTIFVVCYKIETYVVATSWP